MSDPRPNFCPTESERLHQRAMQTGSAALLSRLLNTHPKIIARLQQRAQDRSTTNV